MVVVAAVDRSERASTVIEEAETIATAFDDPVHVVHVLTRSDFLDMGRTAEKEAGKSVSMEQVREAAADVAQDAAGDLTVQSETMGLVGEPAKTILKYANEQDARYVVVGSRKRSPTGKAVFGSIAQSIILNADVPVVTTTTNGQ
ncbi:universal stress protein [Natronobacterium texcoconense]|nr:universal stress protein [Natronobacterium texcoconense]